MQDTAKVPREPEGGKPARRPLVADDLADQLLGKVASEGVELPGPEGRPRRCWEAPSRGEALRECATCSLPLCRDVTSATLHERDMPQNTA